MIYKKYEITKQEDVFTGKGFLYVVHSPNKDDYYHHAKTLQTCKKWIDENEFPVRPLTPARKAKLEKEKRSKKMPLKRAQLHLLKEGSVVIKGEEKLTVRKIDQWSIYLINENGNKRTVKNELVGILEVVQY